jgi:hypothetical protein
MHGAGAGAAADTQPAQKPPGRHGASASTRPRRRAGPVRASYPRSMEHVRRAALTSPQPAVSIRRRDATARRGYAGQARASVPVSAPHAARRLEGHACLHRRLEICGDRRVAALPCPHRGASSGPDKCSSSGAAQRGQGAGAGAGGGGGGRGRGRGQGAGVDLDAGEVHDGQEGEAEVGPPAVARHARLRCVLGVGLGADTDMDVRGRRYPCGYRHRCGHTRKYGYGSTYLHTTRTRRTRRTSPAAAPRCDPSLSATRSRTRDAEAHLHDGQRRRFCRGRALAQLLPHAQ